MTEIKYGANREINELRNQFALSKRIGFFFGAGTSMSLGIPGITELTQKIIQSLGSEEKLKLDKITDCLNGFCEGEPIITIEDILNHIRLIRQITRETDNKDFDGVNGREAKELDITICDKIYQIIADKEKSADISSTIRFASWLNWLPRDYSKEIFTINYDLIFEKAFEALRIPYFDGFVGANEPFFLPESIESKNKLDSPPFSWIRLWKIHGSFGWFWQERAEGDIYRIVRLGTSAKDSKENNELVIYPSRDKYELSRRQPFTAYFDRFKSYLQDGECLFVINGYSFSDEHINDIIFNSLKQNNRLHIIAFLFSDENLKRIQKQIAQYINISAFSPSMAIIGGFAGDWDLIEISPEFEEYFDMEHKKLKLGDFKVLTNFLINVCGNKALKEDKKAE